jgi:hypothetical protein
MTSLKNAFAVAATVAVLATAGFAYAAIPATDSTTGVTADTSIVLAAADTEDKRVKSTSEFDRQSAILAPKDGDNTRLYTFGGLGAVIIILLGLVFANRNKWAKPEA